MADPQKMLAKVRDLLNLADNAGATEAEGETAARMAQILMARHGITEEAVRQAAAADGHAPKAAPIDSELWGSWRARPTWVGRLAVACCQVNGCFVYWDSAYNPNAGRRHYALRVCGTAADREMTLTLLALLKEQVERSSRRCAQGMGRTYVNNFRLGMVGRLHTRLKDAHAQAEREARTETTGAALVIVDRAILARREAAALAKAWITNNGTKLRSRSTREQSDARARAHGAHEGDKATLRHDRVGGGS